MKFTHYVTDVMGIFTEVFKNNDQLDEFINDVNIKDHTIRGSYYKLNFALAKAFHNADKDYSKLDYYNRQAFGKIHIVPFNALLTNISAIHRSNNESWQSRLNPGMVTKKIASGINLNKNLKTKGSLLNAKSILSINTSQSNKYDNVLEWYYIGKSNVAFAMLYKDNTLFIRTQALISAIQNSEKKEVILTVNRLLLLFKNIMNQSVNRNIMEYNDVKGLKLHHRKVYNESRSMLTSSMQYSSEWDPKIDSDKIFNIFTKAIKSYYKNSIYGIDGHYSYGRILNNIGNSFNRQQKIECKKSFEDGILFGNKMINCGWTRSNKQFSESKHHVLWSKEVSIIPDSFIYYNKRYLIPDDYKKWHIKTLYISSSCILFSDERHPNVSSNGKVCLGTLKIDLYASIESLKVLLDKVEELLELINYDSPHDSNDRANLLDVSELIEIVDPNEENGIEVIVADADISLIGEDDEDDDEDEEIVLAINNRDSLATATLIESESGINSSRSIIQGVDTLLDEMSLVEEEVNNVSSIPVESHYSDMMMVHDATTSLPLNILSYVPSDTGTATTSTSTYSSVASAVAAVEEEDTNIVTEMFRLTPENII